jgi:uncharacterized SAM-binding protein YcdF (DUF218 family)
MPGILKRHPRLKVVLWLLGIMVVLGLLGLASLFFPRTLLTVDSGPVRGDVLVVLGGGRTERALRAAELYKQGVAPRILCSGLGDCRSNQALLEKSGVPAAAIVREELSRNTSENVRFSLPLLRQLKARRVIIVTTWYHSRRAWRCFEHYAPDLTFYSRPAYAGYPASPWQPQAIRGHVKLEYLKLLGYWVRYGVCPI